MYDLCSGALLRLNDSGCVSNSHYIYERIYLKKFIYVIIATISSIIAFSFVQPASAVSDITYTLTEASHSSYQLCDSVSACSGYKYLILSYNFVASDNIPFRIRFNGASTNDIAAIPKATSSVIYELNDGTSSVNYYEQSTTNLFLTGSNTITITLTDNLSSEPCPEPEPCDCPIDCSEPAIVQLFKSGFWGVATALTTIIVPVLALFLIFRIVHDLLWGKG